MSVKPIHHYSMENPASVYDEEALTALELAARTAGKVNECVQAFNNHEDYTHKVIQEHETKTTEHLEKQDQEIDEAVDYMKDSIRETTAGELAGMKENGEFAEIIESQVFTDFSNRTGWVVTPEQFGAKGDGVTDDSQAFIQALATGKTVELGNKVYVLREAVNLPVGGKIVGSKNSIVWAYAPTVFHITEKNTISGFTIRVKGADVHNVFEADDNSGGWNMSGDGALLYTVIDNMTVYNDLASGAPDDYTVCHFHVTTNAFYGITVRDCTFCNNHTVGYAVRVYSDGSGWLSTCAFNNINTGSFKWHYFFAKNDKELVNNSGGMHTLNGCIGQSAPATHGFLFTNGIYNAKVINCTTWDWGSSSTGSETCRGTPYVLNKNYEGLLNTSYQNDIDIREIRFYDGETFTESGFRHDHIVKLGGKYNQMLIPKYVGLPMTPCVKLGAVDASNANQRFRFYLCDRYGITYVSIVPSAGKVFLSQPIMSNTCFGVSADGKSVYIYNPSGNLPSNLGVMSIPVSNSMIGYGGGNTKNTEYTTTVWSYYDDFVMDSVPADIVECTKTLASPAYVTDANGAMYKLSVTKDDAGNNTLAITRAYNGVQETNG